METDMKWTKDLTKDELDWLLDITSRIIVEDLGGYGVVGSYRLPDMTSPERFKYFRLLQSVKHFGFEVSDAIGWQPIVGQSDMKTILDALFAEANMTDEEIVFWKLKYA